MVTIEQRRTAEQEFLQGVVDAGCRVDHIERDPKGNLIAILVTPPLALRHITITQTVGR